jgi:hypothetical protein
MSTVTAPSDESSTSRAQFLDAITAARHALQRARHLVRRVKGVLFADYVRMIRTRKDVDWATELRPEDMPYLRERVEPRAWYPMASFERMGNAILKYIANGDMQAVRMFGRFTVEPLRSQYLQLVVDGDPAETMQRFRVLRSTFFDFEALELPMLLDDHAHVVIRYHMGQPAEEAASYQTMGFFERLIELAGGTDVAARFLERSWDGHARTTLELTWTI